MKKIHPTERLWLLLKPDKKEIRNVYIYAIFFGLVNLSLPVGIQSIINLIQGGQMSTSWVILIIFVILGIIITSILQILQLRITENLQQKIFTRATFDFAYRLPKIKLEAMIGKYAPELMNRFFDVISIQKGLSKILIDFSTASIQTVFGLILLSLYHPFFIVYSLVLIALVWSIFRLTSKKGLSTSLEESFHKYNVAHWLEELARTSVSFKLAGETDLPLKRANDVSKHYVDARESHFKVLVNQYILLLIFKVLVAAGLLIVGSILVIEQQMNIGQFVAAEIIILMILSSVEKLVMSLESIYDVITALEKVGQVTDLELESKEGIDIQQKENRNGMCVSINNMTFKYPFQNTEIFRDASMHINEGERVLVFGGSESGKTTLLYVLGGLYPVHTGSVVYNGVPFGNLNPEKLRGNIGDCLMDELLFEGTIFENISMGRERATFENVTWAVENLGLDDFIKDLPKGYNTVIDPQGKQFAKGIVDKLILARSIADKPKLLLIKDAFRSMIGEDRERIMNFLTSKENGWTIVIATRDESLRSKVDKVYEAKGKSINLLSS